MKESAPHDIDLVDLFINIFLFFKRRLLLISIFTIVGVVIGIVFHKTTVPQYEASMKGTSRLVDNSILINVYENLAIEIATENYERTANLLDINLETAQKLIKLSIKNIAESEREHDNRFQLTLTLAAPDVLDSLEDKIIDFAITNAYIQEEMRVQRRQYEQLVMKIAEEVEELDSLQKTGDTKAELVVFGENGGLANSIIGLEEKRNEYERTLTFIEQPVIVLQNFAIMKTKSSRSKTIAISAVLMLFLGIGIGLLIELNQLIIKRQS